MTEKLNVCYRDIAQVRRKGLCLIEGPCQRGVGGESAATREDDEWGYHRRYSGVSSKSWSVRILIRTCHATCICRYAWNVAWSGPTITTHSAATTPKFRHQRFVVAHLCLRPNSGTTSAPSPIRAPTQAYEDAEGAVSAVTHFPPINAETVSAAAAYCIYIW